jgi:hypothetical protein
VPCEQSSFSAEKSILHARLACIAQDTLRKAEKSSRSQAERLKEREIKSFRTMTTNNIQNRLITPELEEALKGYPLYSQDGKKKDATCIVVFSLGNVRWYIMEGQREGDDFTFYGIVAGLQETEYGYASANEMASIAYDASEYGLGTLRFEQDKQFKPCNLSEIEDEELQEFLSRLYDKD